MRYADFTLHLDSPATYGSALAFSYWDIHWTSDRTGQQHATQISLASSTAKLFEKMKTLEGVCLGTRTSSPLFPEMQGKLARIGMLPTSRGHASLHEMKVSSIPGDPVTMIYIENDQVVLAHHRDMENQPRMEGKISVDGKTITFDFIDSLAENKRAT